VVVAGFRALLPLRIPSRDPPFHRLAVLSPAELTLSLLDILAVAIGVPVFAAIRPGWASAGDHLPLGVARRRRRGTRAWRVVPAASRPAELGFWTSNTAIRLRLAGRSKRSCRGGGSFRTHPDWPCSSPARGSPWPPRGPWPPLTSSPGPLIAARRSPTTPGRVPRGERPCARAVRHHLAVRRGSTTPETPRT